MKKMFSILALILAVALVSGCGSASSGGFDKKELTLSEHNVAETNTQASMSIADGKTDGTGEITVNYVNLTDIDYTFDALQRLEVKLDGEWYIVPDLQNFVTLQIFTLPASSSVEGVFRFEGHYEPLHAGTYRIVRSFVSYAGDHVLASVEFEIK